MKKYNIDKPFLRWAGGKSWLIKYLSNLDVNLNFNTYHEPFLGGGSVYFNLQPQNAILSDSNKELIDTYLAIKTNVERVITELTKFSNNEETYYNIRSSQFNSKYKRAARFIFLNQTSFNGIYRVNLNGEYNVPYGYRTTAVFSPDLLREIHKMLQTAELFHGDFASHEEMIRENDFVFLDPPYTVTHNDNGFVKYNQKLFSIEDQYRLSNFIDLIKTNGAYYILTNAAHSFVEELFEKGDYKVKLKRASLIGGTNSKRGQYEEFLFTNIPSPYLRFFT